MAPTADSRQRDVIAYRSLIADGLKERMAWLVATRYFRFIRTDAGRKTRHFRFIRADPGRKTRHFRFIRADPGRK